MAESIESKFPRVPIEHRDQLRSWLAKNASQRESIWLVLNKKGSGSPYVPYEEIVQELLCFGWVDSRPAKLDEKRSMLLASPRKAGSSWSKPNRDRVEVLEAQGLVEPCGRRVIEQAKRDGSWLRLAEVETLEPPPDLDAALIALPLAKANFEAFPASTRRGILEWLQTAKTPETRQRRIANIAELAAQNIRANQPRQPSPKASSPVK